MQKLNWKMLALGVVLTLALALGGYGRALADDYNCTGAVGAITVDNLRVPQNATCTLTGTTVEGNVFVENNATLHAYTVHVDGNIQAENAARVNVYTGSFVGGSIQIVQSGAADIQGVAINSDLFFDENDQFLNAADNTIGGNLQAFQNTGGVSIVSNTIDGNLQCLGNMPPPTGGGNIVHGSMENQCANFGGNPPTPTATPPTPTTTPPTPTATPPGPTPTPPGDDDFTCSGYVGAITVENLRVRQDAACTLVGTRVDGNIFVENNAQLLADDVHVGGNIQAENAAKVNVYPGSFVGGSIQIVQSGEAAIHGVEIDSDLFFDDNSGFINAAYNTIGGNLQAFQNTGGVSVIANAIDGNLQCLSNQPAPVGGGNIVQGNMEDQCAGFGGNAPPAPPPVPAMLLSPADAAYLAFLPLMGR